MGQLVGELLKIDSLHLVRIAGPVGFHRHHRRNL
jgi:hypothetical protein